MKQKYINMKKALREMQTLCAGCSKAEPKIFALLQTPFPGEAGRSKFNQLEMVTTFTYRPTNTYTHKQTGLITITLHR